MSSFLPIPNTSVKNAFDFNSTIKPQQVFSRYSNICIFCSNNESVALMSDGSFRKCLRCQKHFKARVFQVVPNPNPNPMLSQPTSYKTPIFPTIRPNFMPNKPGENKYPPNNIPSNNIYNKTT
jgi:hypothetical protein